MENKSSVSALQEFCAQAKTGNPVYDYIDGEDGGYVCKVVLMDVEAYGNGRSKRDAKHLAASNIMRKLKISPGLSTFGRVADGADGGESTDSFILGKVAEEMTNMNRDMLKELRDYCVRNEMPLPTIEIVQQSGMPSAPEFVACCTVASITRYGKSDKKKDARQRAAIEMLHVISDGSDKCSSENRLISATPQSPNDIDSTVEDLEAERRRKFKTYRELTDSGDTTHSTFKLCDRHNYFKTYHTSLKDAAYTILNCQDYLSTKTQLIDVLDALKLTPNITTIESTSIEPILMITLNCDYDACFLGFESRIYKEMLDYFRSMLI